MHRTASKRYDISPYTKFTRWPVLTVTGVISSPAYATS